MISQFQMDFHEFSGYRSWVQEELQVAPASPQTLEVRVISFHKNGQNWKTSHAKIHVMTHKTHLMSVI